jgi:predicted AAA+ superfamily ATPase
VEALEELLEKASGLIERLERLVPAGLEEPDWSGAIAFRWRGAESRQPLQPIRNPHLLALTEN